MYNKGLFANWVPKPVQLLLIVFFLLPILVISGVYTGNLSYMSGDLGTNNEWLVFANYAGIVGMGVSMPVIFRFKMAFHTKYLMLRTFLILALLSFAIGTTDSNFVIVACSFFIGFFKMFAMMEVVLPTMFIISPTGNRPKFYSIFYPLAIIIPQVAGYLLTKVGFFTFWQNASFIMAMIMLVCALLATIFMHNQRYDRKVPLYYIDWMGMFVYATVFLAMAYFIAFAKQQNYFRSDAIVTATFIVIIGIIIFQMRQKLIKRPFVDFRALNKYNVIHGVMMLFMLGFLLAGSSLQSRITRGVLGFSTITDNSYNLWMIPGIIVASAFSLLWLTKEKSIKTYIIIGFTAFMFYYVCMYFLISPNVSYNQLIFPNVIRGFAMTILFIGIWLYALSNLSVDAMLGVAAILIITRTMLGPGVWSVLLNYIDGFYQVESLNNIAGKMDASAYSKSTAMQLYRNVKINTLINATQRLYGFMILMASVILVYITFLNFEGLGKRKLISFRKRFRRKNKQSGEEDDFQLEEEVGVNAEIEVQKTEAESISGAAI
ncbi:hypothetical protein ACRASX_06310 [Flavobacterium sp. TMP13]|uniref:hypothetical protein n=1 Tax=Flavobacterium sp. TMP13 TaxID=3425950 RepID=UPI003D7847D9